MPSFRDFEAVTPPDFDQWYGKAITGFLHAATRLRTFSINLQAWEDGDLEHLAGIPTLRKTRVYLPSADCAWLARVPAPGGPFPALVDLTLDVLSLEHAAPFFVAWGAGAACRLQRLAVNATQRPASALVPAFFAVLAAHCSPSTLAALSLSDKGTSEGSETAPDRDTDRDACTLTADALFPLTVFGGLRTLALDLSARYALDGAGLAALLPSWPALEQLSIGAGHGWAAGRGKGAPLTFAGLAQVVGAAPRTLVSLHVAIDAFSEDLPVLVGEGVPTNANGSIRTVNLLDTYVEEDEACAGRLARNLARIFPRLERVDAKMKPSPPPPEPEPEPEAEADGQAEAGAEDGDEAMDEQADGGAAVEAPQPQPEAEVEAEAAAVDAAPAPMDTDAAEDGKYEGLATREFWRSVEQQIATVALLRDADSDVVMELS